jgi:hemolysin III
MNILDFREPVSAWTHATWLVLSLPATIFLLKRCSHGMGRRLSLLVFGLSLACCYAGSALFHGVRVSKSGLDVYDRLDHVGIFVLIAGSYTPIAWNLLRARWRWGVLAAAWGLAVGGSLLYLEYGVLPSVIGTAIYLGMGWGAIFCYLELSRYYPHRRLAGLILGGVFYSVGAVINLAHWPVLWPGVFGAHELFHVFVMMGSLSHYLFMLNVVLPANPAEQVEAVKRPPLGIELRPTQHAQLGKWRVQFARVRSDEPTRIPR